MGSFGYSDLDAKRGFTSALNLNLDALHPGQMLGICRRPICGISAMRGTVYA